MHSFARKLVEWPPFEDAWEQFWCHTNCASMSSFSVITGDIKSGTWIMPFHGFQYLASFAWFRCECVNHVTPGIKESVICVCGWNHVVLTCSNEFSFYSSTFMWSYMYLLVSIFQFGNFTKLWLTTSGNTSVTCRECTHHCVIII